MKRMILLVFACLLTQLTISAQPTKVAANQTSGAGGVEITGTPTAGQVPTAVTATTATWQTPSGGSSVPTTREDGTIVATSATTWNPLTASTDRGLDATVNNGFVYTVNLGAASNCQNCEIWFSNFNTGVSGTGTMVIDGFGTELIGSGITFTIGAGGGATFQSVNTSGVIWTWRRKW